MNIGTFFKALLSVAEADAGGSLLPAIASAATSLATNQGPVNVALQALSLKQAALKTGAQVAQDEITTLDDIVLLQLQTLAKGQAVVTPASAAAAALGETVVLPPGVPVT
jgi:hypothetical protein